MALAERFKKTILNSDSIAWIAERCTPEADVKKKVEAGWDNDSKVILAAYEALARSLEGVPTLSGAQFEMRAMVAYMDAVEQIYGNNPPLTAKFWTPNERETLTSLAEQRSHIAQSEVAYDQVIKGAGQLYNRFANFTEDLFIDATHRQATAKKPG